MPSQISRKIDQELRKLEKQITIKLEQYYKQKIKGSQVPADFIRQNEKEIKNIIRDTIQASWLFSHDIIRDTTKQRVDLTTKDIEGIELTTNNMENYFWAVAHDLLTRETAFKVSNGQLQELTPFDVHAAFVGLGGWFAYYAFNYAMESKSQELGNIQLRFVVRDDCVDTKLCLPLNGQIFIPGSAPELPIHKHCHCKLIPVINQ